jgi:hypothetical protein
MHPDVGLVDRNIGQVEDYDDPNEVLRNFDPVRNVFWFRGETFELSPLISALRDLQAMAQERRAW